MSRKHESRANECDWLTRSPDSPSTDPVVDWPTREILIAQRYSVNVIVSPLRHLFVSRHEGKKDASREWWTIFRSIYHFFSQFYLLARLQEPMLLKEWLIRCGLTQGSAQICKTDFINGDFDAASLVRLNMQRATRRYQSNYYANSFRTTVVGTARRHNSLRCT